MAAKMGGVSSGERIIVDQWPKPQWRLFSLEGLTGLGGWNETSAGWPLVNILSRIAGLAGSVDGETAFELPYTLTVE